MSRFTAVKITPATKENLWIEDVAAMVAATDADPEFGAQVVFPVKDEAREVAAIRDAAKTLGKTVRIITRDDSALTRVGSKDNGKPIFEVDVVLTLAIRDKYKDGRGRKPASAAPVETPAKGK